MSELVVDNFAGGGGASSGIEQALGRAVDFAINHDAEAVEPDDDELDLSRHVSHFATCAQANQHRRVGK